MKTKKVVNCIFACALLVVFFALMVPFIPVMPKHDLDSSWVLGMNQAVAQGLIIGTDIIFTFGPYSSVYTTAYHPGTYGYIMIGSAYFAIIYSFVLFVILRDSGIIEKVGVLIVFVWFVYQKDTSLFVYPLAVGIYSLQVAKKYQKNNLLTLASLVLVFSGFGFLPLIKGSLIAAVFATMGAVTYVFAIRKMWLYLACIYLSGLCSMIVFWMLAKQPINALPNYFITMLPIVSGYTDAMSRDGNLTQVWIYISASAILMLATLFFTKEKYEYRVFLSLLVFACLFLSMKAGFVRHDAHATIAGSSILLVAVLIAPFISSWAAFTVVISTAISFLYIDAAYVNTNARMLLDRPYAVFSTLVDGLNLRLEKKVDFAEMHKKRLEEIAKITPLPKLAGRSDIYSHDQANLIASGNPWNPRPVFQSYSVYANALSEENSSHLNHSSRPDNIFFKLQSIDKRLPMLMDGASWLPLFERYSINSLENGYILFRANEHPVGEKSSAKKTVQSAKLNQFVSLPESEDWIFVKTNVKLGNVGRFMNLFWKPSHLKITLKMFNGVEREFRFVAGMADEGFYISNLVENHEDVLLQNAGKSVAGYKKVVAFKIEQEPRSNQWQEDYTAEFSVHPRREQGNLLAMVGVADVYKSTKRTIFDEVECNGVFDHLNGDHSKDKRIDTGPLISTKGWLTEATDQFGKRRDMKLFVSSTSNEEMIIDAPLQARPDVAKALGNSNLLNSGFSVLANISSLHGDLSLRMGFKDGDRLYVCKLPKLRLIKH